MIHIDEERVNALIDGSRNVPDAVLDAILEKTRALQRLTLEETAVLLAAEKKEHIKKIFDAAAAVKKAIYGDRVVLFAPLYISNICANTCRYCAFNAENTVTRRRRLTPDEIRGQVRWLLTRGHKRVLVVAGESGSAQSNIDYYVEAVNAVYDVNVGPHRIKRANINCAPLGVDEFRRLKAAGIGTFQIFQETYHEATYRNVHTRGPKSDPDNRIDAVDRAFRAGIDDVGIGVLYGLYDYRFDTLAMLMHVEHLEKTFNVGPHTISMPRIEPAPGVAFTENMPHQLSDEEFKKTVAVLRLAVPYTGIILSTRETAEMRDELVNVGVSQVSAESRTSPGGYSSSDNNISNEIQFSLGDQRTLDEVIAALLARDKIPSFCAACYRSHRTGEAFMNLAKPGTIKDACGMNALITLKEYLEDFASPETRKAGYALIDRERLKLDEEKRAALDRFFCDVDNGIRDRFV